MIPTIELPAEPAVQAAAPKPHHRPLRKRVLHNVRRLHMYFGLFLFPWALLYGVTAFLFNHPGAFPDQPRLAFGRSATDGTALERLPTPREQAAAVVAALNQQQQPAVPYQLGAGDVRYVRDFLVATVKTDDRAFTVLYDVKDGTGTIRETPVTATPVKAPFATGTTAAARPRGVGSRKPASKSRATWRPCSAPRCLPSWNATASPRARPP